MARELGREAVRCDGDWLLKSSISRIFETDGPDPKSLVKTHGSPARQSSVEAHRLLAPEPNA